MATEVECGELAIGRCGDGSGLIHMTLRKGEDSYSIHFDDEEILDVMQNIRRAISDGVPGNN